MSSSDSDSEIEPRRPAHSKSGSPASTPSERSPTTRRAVLNDDEDDKGSTPSHRSASNSPERRPQSSDEEAVISPRKKRVLGSSDEEEEEEGEQNVTQKEKLFGDDVSSDSDAGNAGRDDDDDDEGRAAVDSDGGEEQKEKLLPAVIEATATRNVIDFGDQVVFMRLPNFLSLEKKAFDPEDFSETEEDYVDEEGRRHKLKVGNVIRWRRVVKDDGTETRESNAKVVKWSDGTMSLRLGTEYFDFGLAETNEFSHLFLRQGTGLVSQAFFPDRVVFRPHSTNSKTHQNVTKTMAERTRRGAQIRMIANEGINPEKERQEVARKEEEKFRQAIRAQFATHARGRRDREFRTYHGEEDDYDPDSLNTIKRRYGAPAPIVGHRSESESEDEAAGGINSSDSDEEFRRNKAKAKKIVVQDSDDD
ncbi:unnamed protein product, partial [Mesorhabditis spiculigera]